MCDIIIYTLFLDLGLYILRSMGLCICCGNNYVYLIYRKSVTMKLISMLADLISSVGEDTNIKRVKSTSSQENNLRGNLVRVHNHQIQVC